MKCCICGWRKGVPYRSASTECLCHECQPPHATECECYMCQPIRCAKCQEKLDRYALFEGEKPSPHKKKHKRPKRREAILATRAKL